MNEIDKMFKSSKSCKDFAKNYFNYLSKIFQQMDFSSIEKVAKEFLKSRENGNTIFFIGNGGSASTASHFVNDLSIGTRSKSKHFKSLSLADNNSVITALGNDEGYEYIFSKQLEIYMKPGDIVVAISASGNSPNIINAIEYARSKGNLIIGLTGFDGGKLRKLSNINIHVPSNKGEYGPVEDLHMIIDHLFNSYFSRYIKNEELTNTWENSLGPSTEAELRH